MMSRSVQSAAGQQDLEAAAAKKQPRQNAKQLLPQQQQRRGQQRRQQQQRPLKRKQLRWLQLLQKHSSPGDGAASCDWLGRWVVICDPCGVYIYIVMYMNTRILVGGASRTDFCQAGED